MGRHHGRIFRNHSMLKAIRKEVKRVRRLLITRNKSFFFEPSLEESGTSTGSTPTEMTDDASADFDDATSATSSTTSEPSTEEPSSEQELERRNEAGGKKLQAKLQARLKQPKRRKISTPSSPSPEEVPSMPEVKSRSESTFVPHEYLEQEYHILTLVDKRIRKLKQPSGNYEEVTEYLVHWLYFTDIKDRTWELASDLQHTHPELIEEYEAGLPPKKRRKRKKNKN